MPDRHRTWPTTAPLALEGVVEEMQLLRQPADRDAIAP